MDNFIYLVGENTCKILGDIGLNKLKSALNCDNSDNYIIGLISISIIIFLLLSTANYSASKKNKD